MKASLKFREEQRPLFRAKVPLSILGMPFQSGIVAGDSKELTLNLSTLFESGPSLKLSYRPNDTWKPFSVVLKTGTGAYGSPLSSSLLMTAEFNLLGRGNSPAFMIHFKPRFGDFSIRKSQSSAFENKGLTPGNGVVSDDDSSVEVVDAPALNAGFLGESGFFAGKKLSDFPDAGSISGLFSGLEASARTALPVKSRAMVNFRWGVRVPADGKRVGDLNPAGGLSIPFLVLNKIGIEQFDGEGSKDIGGVANADLVGTCMAVKRQLEVLQSENGLLRRAVEDLRHEISGGRVSLDLNAGKYSRKSERTSNKKVKSEEGASEELNKALMGATGSGI